MIRKLLEKLRWYFERKRFKSDTFKRGRGEDFHHD